MKNVPNVSPPGGIPYHPNEFMADQDPGSDVVIKTGILGLIFTFACMVYGIFIFAITLPFILFGVMEVVAAKPNHYRVRWIREDA